MPMTTTVKYEWHYDAKTWVPVSKETVESPEPWEGGKDAPLSDAEHVLKFVQDALWPLAETERLVKDDPKYMLFHAGVVDAVLERIGDYFFPEGEDAGYVLTEQGEAALEVKQNHLCYWCDGSPICTCEPRP